MILTTPRGVLNTYGVYQTYYQISVLKDTSPSTIAWIGSIQSFLLMIVGALTGPVYDAGYFRELLWGGSFFVVFGHMMLSLSTKYYQVLLSQAICIGGGAGLLFVPGVAILSTYFNSRLAFATGAAAVGSSLGLYIVICMQRHELTLYFRRRHLPHHVKQAHPPSGIWVGHSNHWLPLPSHSPHSQPLHEGSSIALPETPARRLDRFPRTPIRPLLPRLFHWVYGTVLAVLLRPIIRHLEEPHERELSLLSPEYLERGECFWTAIPQYCCRSRRAVELLDSISHTLRSLDTMSHRSQQRGDSHRHCGAIRLLLWNIRLVTADDYCAHDKESWADWHTHGHVFCDCRSWGTRRSADRWRDTGRCWIHKHVGVWRSLYNGRWACDVCV